MKWFEERGWQPFDFQREVWAAFAEGKSGLLHASTGSGKTLAAFFGMAQALQAQGLTALWITPMRALAADTERALADLGWTVARRTGDTSATERAKQQRKPPNLLITTPESLTLLLSQADARERLQRVQAVVVDEWHELLGSKRGVQLQLALARLRTWNPKLITWGLSATLGNLDEALHQLGGGILVRGAARKALDVQTLLPPKPERFAWAGHLGLSMLPAVVEALESAASTLVFTNTRAQSELWYQALLAARPDWAGLIALHHGSLDAKVRDWVESATKAGQLRAVVCTSSLDLGVDFLPVEQVIQIGSAKSLARLLQRAGRSGHAPGRASKLRLVPTHSLELLEAAAVQTLLTGDPPLEARTPPPVPLDVLVQHLCTVALGGGFRPDELLREVRSAPAYAGLSDADWAWALAFVRQGGDSLAAYPDFHRVQVNDDGEGGQIWQLPDARLARRHRANIGTLSSEASVTVQFLGGAKLGQVEEGFIARLKPGDVFLFAGRALELVRVKEMTAYVRKAKSSAAAVPRWAGGRMSLSPFLGAALREQVSAAARGAFAGPEMQALRPLLELQARWSALPRAGELLLEHWSGREGHALALYPFAGRAVHSALAAWLAWALARAQPNSFSLAVTDQGLLLLAAEPVEWTTVLPPLLQAAPSVAQLEADLAASLNAGELARRRFRDIARIAGLVFQSHPGERRTARQLQASSGLYFDVFTAHDPGNLLLRQAREEALREELDLPGLHALLQRLCRETLLWREPGSATPFSFPLVVERWRERLSTETLNQRIAREIAQLERRVASLKRRHR